MNSVKNAAEYAYKQCLQENTKSERTTLQQPLKALVEFACSEDSTLCQVAGENGLPFLRLHKKFADLMDPKVIDHTTRRLDCPLRTSPLAWIITLHPLDLLAVLKQRQRRRSLQKKAQPGQACFNDYVCKLRTFSKVGYPTGGNHLL